MSLKAQNICFQMDFLKTQQFNVNTRESFYGSFYHFYDGTHLYLLTKKINDHGVGSHIPESYQNNLIN